MRTLKILLLLTTMLAGAAQAFHHDVEVIRGVAKSGELVVLDSARPHCLVPGQRLALVGQWLNLAAPAQNHLLGFGARWSISVDGGNAAIWIADPGMPSVYFSMDPVGSTVTFTAPEEFETLVMSARETERGEALRFARAGAGVECVELPASVLR